MIFICHKESLPVTHKLGNTFELIGMIFNLLFIESDEKIKIYISLKKLG